MNTFKSQQVSAGQKVAEGQWPFTRYGFTVTDSESGWLGGFIRVHDGFPVFSDLQQADWVCELMRYAYAKGHEAARTEIRIALGIEEKDE